MKTNTKALLDDCLDRHPSLVTCSFHIEQAFEAIVQCARQDGCVLVCGNGGSAADADHIVGEFMNKFRLRRPAPSSFLERLQKLGFEDAEVIASKVQVAVRSISLGGQAALSTAIANDIGPEMLFAQQVFGYGHEGDILIALSTSGNSPNVVNALKVARALRMITIGFTNQSGGVMNPLCDVLIRVPQTITYKVQELHLPAYHAICAMVEEELFGD